jgi:hypothetical protein
MAMIAITTNNSISVNALLLRKGNMTDSKKFPDRNEGQQPRSEEVKGRTEALSAMRTSVNIFHEKCQ